MSRRLMGDCIADAVPDLILHGNQRGRRQRQRWLRSLDAINDESCEVDFTIRVVRITFPISAEQCRARSRSGRKC